MAYLVMKDGLFLACSKPFRMSKRQKAAKTWNNDALAVKAINKMKEEGIDTSGMIVKSEHMVKMDAQVGMIPLPIEEVKPVVLEVKKPKVFEAVEEKPLTALEAKAVFSGTNIKCLSCIKDCKQTFKDKLVFCPLFKEKVNG